MMRKLPNKPLQLIARRQMPAERELSANCLDFYHKPVKQLAEGSLWWR
jgi:hypothetical protein